MSTVLGWTSLVYKSIFQGSGPKVSACSLKATVALVGKLLLEKSNQLAKEFLDDLHIILFNSAVGLTSYQIITHRSHELCKKYCSLGRKHPPLTPCHRFWQHSHRNLWQLACIYSSNEATQPSPITEPLITMKSDTMVGRHTELEL